jgi:hypothetical protein
LGRGSALACRDPAEEIDQRQVHLQRIRLETRDTAAKVRTGESRLCANRTSKKSLP